MNQPHMPDPASVASHGEVPSGDWSGQVLAGRYTLGRLLGTGGMAEVYAAVDRRLGRTVAVKVLRPGLARDQSVRTRFRREAQSAAALNHPAVVAVHDTGDDEAEPFIVMEYVAGHTLREVMHRGQPMLVDQAVQITVGVLTALELAHRAGIVHRDIKPGNVMLTPEGAVKVMDFGISRALDDDLTITQTVIGTPAYLSPEHAEGRPVDERSDLYSAGCVLFELLTGRPPFVSASAYVVAVQHIQEAPPVPSMLNPALPPVLDKIVARALVKDREQRYQTAAQFRADLEALCTSGTVTGAEVPRSSGVRESPTDPIVLGTTARMPPAGLPGASPDPVAATASSLPAPGPLTPAQSAAPSPAAMPSRLAAAAGAPSPTGQAAALADAAASAVPPDRRQGWAGQSTAARDRAQRRRWPWVAAVVLVAGGGVAFMLSGDGASEPNWHDVFDPTTVAKPSDGSVESSIAQVSKAGSITVQDTREKVWELDSASAVRPWVQSTQQGGATVVTISTDVLFDFGTADVGPVGQAVIVEAVTSAPNGASISVTGYTDSRGSDDTNIQLSLARAEAVAAIIRSVRLDVTVIPVGMGSADQVAPNTNPDGSDSPEGRTRNRRVEIRYG